VIVTAARRGNQLELSVVDDGVGEKQTRDHRDGVGLGNTRARLLSLYGSDHRFEAGGASAGGFTVHIEIPYRTDTATKEPLRRESPDARESRFSRRRIIAPITRPDARPPSGSRTTAGRP